RPRPALLASLLRARTRREKTASARCRGHQLADLSVMYPGARASAPMLSSLGACAPLKETPTAPGVVGLVAVVIGIGLISTQGDLGAFRKPEARTGLWWGLVTGALIATYTVNDGYGVKGASHSRRSPRLGLQPSPVRLTG